MNKKKLTKSSAIAIIGMGCYYPGSSDLKTLWENIVSGKRQFRRFPDQRLPMALYHDSDRNNVDKTYASQAACIEGFEFDWIKRRIPKKTVETTDIVHWLAYEAALKALDNAGYQKGQLPKETTGVILGNTLTGEQTRALFVRQRWPFMRRVLEASLKDFQLSADATEQVLLRTEEYYKSIFPAMTEDSLAGGLSNTIAGRVCNVLDVNGGGFTVDGACASSLIAVATAADKLVNGSLDAAFAGGVDVSMDTFEMVGFARTGALTPDEMRVYDRRGNGFIPGEGCGFILMKRLEDAKRDGDKVYAVLRGWGISSDGRGGITAPNGKYQGVALNRAYEMAGYSAADLDFIEGHGTGTTVGDREELKGIAATVGNIIQGDLRGCGVTSFKSIMGHTKAAAGAGGLIKAILAVNQRVIPATGNCEEPNPFFDTSEGQNIYPILLGQSFDANKVMRAGVSAMGFGGINTHVTIESHDEPCTNLRSELPVQTLMASTQKTELYPFAADNVAALVSAAQQLQALAYGMSIAELPDLAAQWSQTQATEGTLRAAIIAHHPRQLDEALSTLIANLQQQALQPNEVRILAKDTIFLAHSQKPVKVGLLFPGQGSQQINMAFNLVRRFDWARKMLEDADEALQQQGWAENKSLAQFIFRPTDRALDKAQLAQWKSELTETRIAQPAICLASALWYERLKRLGINPVAVGGHSLGELSAFYAAGAFDFKTLMALATLRGQAMSSDSNSHGAMAALMTDVTNTKALLEQVTAYVTIANINDPKQTVVSGEKQAIDQVLTLARNAGIQGVRLAVSNAFHSNLVQSAADILRTNAPLPATLAQHLPIVSAMNGELVTDGIALADYFAKQVLSPVDFIRLVHTMHETCDLLFEVGPGQVLTNMTRRIIPEKRHSFPVEASALNDSDLNHLLAHYFVTGGEVRWENLYEQRLIRPFTAASQKIFIENPCEREFKITTVKPELAELFRHTNAHQNSQLAFTNQPSVAVIPQHTLITTTTSSSIANQQANLMDENNSHPNHSDTASKSELIHPEHPIAALLLGLLEENTGFPRDSMALNSRLLDDLNLDSIKAAELIGEVAQRLDIPGEVDPAPLANASLAEIVLTLDTLKKTGRLPVEATRPNTVVMTENILVTDENEASESPTPAIDGNHYAQAEAHDVIPAPTPAKTVQAGNNAIDSSKAEQVLLDLIEESTGFPRESLGLDLRLLDDLNLDSIKAAELIATAAKQLALEGEIDPAQFANASLSELATVLSNPPATVKSVTEAVAEVAPQPQLVSPPAPTKQIAPQADSHSAVQNAWVRNFIMRPVVQPIQDKYKATLSSDVQAAIICERDEVDLARALATQFKQAGIKTNGASFKAIQERKTLLESASPHYIVVILPRTTSEGAAEDTVRKMVGRLQGIASVKANKHPVMITFTQFAGGHFGVGNNVPEHLEQCGSMALASSLHLEQKDLQVRVVDFVDYVNPEQYAEKVMAEMSTTPKFMAAGYTHDMTRCVLRPHLHEGINDKSRHITWQSDEVVLVTGGAKGITAECALAYAKATKVKMALVGSSAAPDTDVIDHEINQTLQRFANEGLKANYYSCDLTSGEALATLVVQIQQDFGNIAGVIHGAALNKPRPMSYVSAEDAYQEVSPKILGALHLCNLFEQHPLKLFAALTSIIGVSGMTGNSWYGFSNEVVDIILGQYQARHPETEIISTAFSVWSEVGMGARMGSTDYLAKMGISAIPTEEGTQRFSHLLLNSPNARQVVVTARLAGLDTWITPSLTKPYSQRFLEDIVYQYPQVELIARSHLTVERDQYVKDHVWKGSHLFPTVFGLEAMAQAVAYITGIHRFKNLRIENVLLERPIVVNEKTGVKVQTHARVLERKADKILRVFVTLSTEQSQYRTPHFSACFVIGSAQNLSASSMSGLPTFPEQALDIEPKQDLYSWLLFQGPAYQRLQDIYRIDNDFCMFSVESQSNEETQWLLGSPYVRDALLQSVQPMVPQHISLPVRIDAINIADAGKSLPDTIKGVSVNERLQDKEYYTSVYMTDQAGEVLERLEGYQIRILEYRNDFPTAKQLVAPQAHDETTIQTAAKQYAELLGIQLPMMKLDYIPNLSKMAKAQRHAVMTPIIEQWQQDAAGQSVNLTWSEEGKPVLVSQDGQKIGLSLSHNCSHLLMVSGHGEHGCDLERIAIRSESEWKALLGNDSIPLLQAFRDLGDDLNCAGTRLWAVRETLFKATGEFSTDIEIKAHQQRGVLLSATTSQTTLEIITFPVSLLRGGEKLVAIRTVAASPETPAETAEPSAETLAQTAPIRAGYIHAPKASVLKDDTYLTPERLENIGYQPAHYLIGLKQEPHLNNAPAFVQRTPLFFKDSQNLSRGIYFSNFFLWMGKIRESGTYPIMSRMSEQLTTGKWGLVTNSSAVTILGEATSGDIVEVHFWMSKVFGRDNSTFDLFYDWRKLMPDGSQQRVARAEMRASWVRILDHGVVTPEPLPDYFSEFAQAMTETMDNPRQFVSMPETLKSLDMGKILYQSPEGPRNGRLLVEETLQTTLEDANTVGNVYFSNYARWQGLVRDKLFHSLSPEHFRGVGEKGELITTFCEVEHLREAMPFDHIVVTMYVVTVGEMGMALRFEYYRQDHDGSRTKLAVGKQTTIWAKKDATHQLQALAWPEVFQSALLGEVTASTSDTDQDESLFTFVD